jgi:hypothetical protein
MIKTFTAHDKQKLKSCYLNGLLYSLHYSFPQMNSIFFNKQKQKRSVVHTFYEIALLKAHGSITTIFTRVCL